jgi:hypothetical protein
MSGFYDKFIDGAELWLDKFGLMTGSWATLKRFAIGFALASFIVTQFKPGFMFMQDGSARPWMLIEPENPQATPMTWYIFGAIGGLILGVLI